VTEKLPDGGVGHAAVAAAVEYVPVMVDDEKVAVRDDVQPVEKLCSLSLAAG